VIVLKNFSLLQQNVIVKFKAAALPTLSPYIKEIV
jgi:hypothetical protein